MMPGPVSLQKRMTFEFTLGCSVVKFKAGKTLSEKVK
jgi:hypothetical protein